jgi:glycine cleavage system T protein (aminomethyltransferase)
MAEATDLHHTPLEEEHRALSAHLGPFAGWLLPIQYAGTLAEHRAVRQAVGLFDLTHLGTVMVEGPGALGLLQRTMPNDLSKVPVGGAQYNMVLTESGGIVDDLINYRVGEERYLSVPNAANTDAVVGILEAAAGDDVAISRLGWAIIAPQGPRSFELADRLYPGASSLDYMHCRRYLDVDTPVVVSRSGYTGERGFELFVPPELAPDVWRRCLAAGEDLGLQPVGLAARDTLRLEMGYPLHGNDIGPDRTPLEAGLSWAVSLDKGEFTGRTALVRQREEGIPSRLWGLRMLDRLIPRSHYAVSAGGEVAGETTSGTFSPTLEVGIALAYLAPRERFAAGDQVEVDIRGRMGRAEVVRPPFVSSSPT